MTISPAWLVDNVICDSCFECYQDVAADLDDDDVTREVAAQFMAELGADIEDHECDARETGERCDCRCRRG